MKQVFIETITLGTSRGRVLFFTVASLVVFIVPYHWLSNLSLWQRLGWHSAPSIGLTRAYHLLIHGHPVGAWHRNPLIYAVLIVWMVIMIKDLRKLFFGNFTKSVPETDTIG